MRLPCLLQVRVLKLALKSLFSKPYTTGFPREPYEPIKEFRGRPRYCEEDCIGCGACAEVCPSKCIDVVDETGGGAPKRRLTQHFDACIGCGQCERYCTTEKGIKLSNEYRFVGFSPADFEESVEKALLCCDSCGCVIAPVDQLRWLMRRLGPLAFTNPTLMLVSHGELAVADESARPDQAGTQRSERIGIQCPKCRRKTALNI